MTNSSFRGTAGRRRRCGLTAAAVAIWALCGTGAQAAEFSDAQRSEIGDIVREYLLANPEIIRDVVQALEAKEQAAQLELQTKGLEEHADALYRSPDDPVAGNPDGKVTMVEFFDYNCGWCKKGIAEVLASLKEDKELRIVLKEYPIFGENSEYAARAAIAAGKQGKYWDLHVALLQHEGQVDRAAVDEIAKAQGLDMARLTSDMADPSVNELLQRNHKLAAAIGVTGTPAFIVDDRFFPGYVPQTDLLAAIQSVRDNGGCKLC